MLRTKTLLLLPFIGLFLSSCSSTKVIDSWKADNAGDIKSKNFLVITRTNNAEAREVFENAIMRELRNQKIKASVSYNLIENLSPNKKLNEQEVEAAKQMIRDKGFNAIAITVLKEKKQTLQIRQEGGYMAGATVSNAIDPYLYNFYTYYSDPMSVPTSRYEGNYIEPSIQQDRSITYFLETLIFNLDNPDKEQLVGQVLSSLEDPDSAVDVAGNYARTVSRTLRK